MKKEIWKPPRRTPPGQPVQNIEGELEARQLEKENRQDFIGNNPRAKNNKKKKRGIMSGGK